MRAIPVLIVASIFVSASASAQESVKLLGVKPICDNGTHLCRTRVLEVHQDDPGATRVRLTYDAPQGVTFKQPVRGVELEAGGADHHVHVFLTSTTIFECEWYAKKRPLGDNGLAKGYCEVTFDGTAPASWTEGN